MTTVALIGCSGKKAPHAAIPCLLYLGTRFQRSLDVAITRLKVERVFVVSAKHGLLPLYEKIEPYDESLAALTIEERRAWARAVARDPARRVPNATRVTVLADDLYANPLRAYLPDAAYPLAGMAEGAQKAWLEANATLPS
jgi:hypothetical protein